MPSTAIQFDWTQSPVKDLVCDGLVVLVLQQEDPQPLADVLLTVPWIGQMNDGLQGVLAQVVREEKFEGKAGQVMVLRKTPADEVQARRVILVGVGRRAKLSPTKVSAAIEKAVESLLKLDKVYNLTVFFPEDMGLFTLEDALLATVDGAHQATYVSAESKEPACSFLRVDFWGTQPPAPELTNLLKRATVLAEARSFAKDLVNMPPNLKSTDTLVKAAQALDEMPNVYLDLVTDLGWIQSEMPAFYAVARGSLVSDPPKFIRLKYSPAGGSPKMHVALVGKSVVFDTGGYQVKTDNYMNTMKGDMTGGAMALGTLRAIAQLQPQDIALTVYLAATPNKIDSDAYLPDSILSSHCGKKIEIKHTDAEGRLTLIDAVSKAAEDKPDVMLTVATLTGAAMRAVGCHIALMGNDDTWRNRVEAVARKLGEPIQPLDVVEADFEDIKSKLDGADLVNTSKSRFRGAQSAAAFVMSGVPEGLPLVHLDIAGADMTLDEKATGIAQRMLIQFVLECTGF